MSCLKKSQLRTQRMGVHLLILGGKLKKRAHVVWSLVNIPKDHFIVFHLPTARRTAFEFRGTSPASMARGRQRPQNSKCDHCDFQLLNSFVAIVRFQDGAVGSPDGGFGRVPAVAAGGGGGHPVFGPERSPFLAAAKLVVEKRFRIRIRVAFR